jgi:two-component system, OmpR family, alkaline phosphatase synthesis response regulator PhoP
MEDRTVVVIEDDAHIAELLELYLGQAGFRVARAGAGEPGLTLVDDRRPALVIVDIGLPDIDGFEVCRRLRARSAVPIVVLTARGEETDRVVGLELGADDYVTKPFSPRELVARVKAILRRTRDASATRETVVVGDVEVDLTRHEARRDGERVDLAPREFALLAALVDNRGIVLSRRQLLDLAWGYDWYGDERTVDVHIGQLRRKLGDGLPLATLRRTGYRLD